MGSKSSKRNSVNGEQLSRETIQELCHDTGFTEEELLTWHTNFYKDCPDGKLTLRQFEQAYAKIMGKPTQKTANYVKHMFNVYDQDKSQFIDFKEFVMALSAASVVNRLRLVETLFHVFDLDNDGKITKDEIGKMLHTLVDVTNSNHKRRGHHANHPEQTKEIILQKRVDDAFNELNANDDDHITKDEFIEWYMKSGLISDVQPNELNVTDSSRIQQIGKKSRKIMKQTSYTKSNNEQTEKHARLPNLVRHMTRMTERKSPLKYNDDDNDDNYNENHVRMNNNPTTVSSSRYYEDNDIDHERTLNNPRIKVTTSFDDNDSHYSKENERWQHLFNSVLGQIRSQRPDNPEQTVNNGPRATTTTKFNSWKREGEEKLKSEYTRQRSNDQQNRSYLSTRNEVMQSTDPSLDDSSSSPDVFTVRL